MNARPIYLFIIFALTVLAWATRLRAIAQAHPAADAATQERPATDAAGMEVLARGPLHEAFAQPVESPTASREAIISKKPPEAVDEVPPETKPAGTSQWIPGYWSWDDERSDFLWVSGVWRVSPAGQRWVPGYWAAVEGGYRWTSGFWTSSQSEEVTYLPPPPATLEEGPSSQSPSEDHFWIPGGWVYRGVKYAWRPGFWSLSQANWLWMPERYYWTPGGHVHCNGYWDYPLADRGWAFAPVYFHGDHYRQPGYSYRPNVVLDAAQLAAHLFIRPRWGSYYFGDYYAPRYSQIGFFPWFDHDHFHYDPIYSHHRHRRHRGDSDWWKKQRDDFARRQGDERERPDRVFKKGGRGEGKVAVDLDRFVSRDDVRGRSERLASDRLNEARREGDRIKELRNERSRAETVAKGRDEASSEARRRTTLKLPATENPRRANDSLRRLEEESREARRRADNRTPDREPRVAPQPDRPERNADDRRPVQPRPEAQPRREAQPREERQPRIVRQPTERRRSESARENRTPAATESRPPEVRSAARPETTRREARPAPERRVERSRPESPRPQPSRAERSGGNEGRRESSRGDGGQSGNREKKEKKKD